MVCYSLHLLGGVSLEGPDGPLEGSATQPRQLALLALLATNRDGGLGRDKLLACLWPERTGKSARHSLADSLYRLRQSLGEEVVLASGPALRLNPAIVRTDVAEFEAALEAGELEVACALFRGRFLDGFHLVDSSEFEHWSEAESRRLDLLAQSALETLADRAQAAGDGDRAGHWLRRLLSLDPYNSRAVTRLMETLATGGDPANALLLAAEHTSLLAGELGVEPPAELQRLAERLRAAGHVSALAPDANPEAVSAGSQSRPTFSREEPAPPLKQRAPAWTTVAGAAAIVILVGACFAFLRDSGPSLVENRVLVTTFENETGDPLLDPLGRWATELAIGELASTGVLEVVPMEIVLLLDREGESGAEGTGRLRARRSPARETGAGILVSGSFFARRDSVVVRVQIADARGSRVLRTVEPAVVPLGEPGPGLAELARSLAASVASYFDPRVSAVAPFMSPPPSFSSFREYSAGLDAFAVRDFRASLTHFQRAAEMETTYLAPLLKAVAAHRNLGENRQADSLLRLAEGSGDRANPLERESIDILRASMDGNRTAAHRAARRRAERAPFPTALYQQALEARRVNRPRETVHILTGIDPRSPMLRGWIFYWTELGLAHHMMGEYEEELRQARRGRSQYPDALGSLDREARALAALGRTHEVLELAREISSRWPHPGNLWGTALELRAHGELDVANEVLDTMLGGYQALAGKGTVSLRDRQWFGETLYLRGRWDEARSVFIELAREHPDRDVSLGYLGALAARMRDPAGARRYGERLRDLDRPYLWGSHTYQRARISALLGKRDEAVSLLRQAHAEGWSYGLAPHRDIDFENLRDFRPFEDLLRPRE